MGFWGTGLYSGDFAMDLRKTVSAVLRLPFDVERLVDILCEAEPAAAHNPSDEDHTTFWLVLADRFARLGIASGRVRETAFGIIDREEDAEASRRLGMTAAEVRRRQQVLADLRKRIAAPTAGRTRTVLRNPQPLLMARGDVIVYPTCAGRCINPYYRSKELNVQYTKAGPARWQQDGWGAAVILDCGRAFDFLSWYRPLTATHARPDKPSLDTLRDQSGWRVELPGTCSAVHFKRMELERAGSVAVDPDKIRSTFGDLRPGISAAVSDISIANRLRAIADRSPSIRIPSSRDRHNTVLDALDEILTR